MAKMLRVGKAVINLAFVTSWDRHDGFPNGGDAFEEDEKRPRLFVMMLTGRDISITERAVVEAGYASMDAFEAALTVALDAYIDG